MWELLAIKNLEGVNSLPKVWRKLGAISEGHFFFSVKRLKTQFSEN